MKTCSKCGQTGDFYKDNNGKDGFRSICKKCDIKRRMLYAKHNPDTTKSSKKRYAVKNKDKIRRIREALELAEPGYFARKARESRLKRGESYKRYRRDYDKRRRQRDMLYRLRRSLSNRLNKAVASGGYTKESSIADVVGCEWLFLKQYLESKFEPGMTWKNYGSRWTIDHICPCSQARDEEELMKLQHYSNLRPSFDNFTKSDKSTPEAIEKCRILLGRDWI